ncbi:hypothetical protein RP20_CCG020253 [Aedes albopictus]|nr:hypothetical protein RP20_CCG020253 [Aedes albopictus]
MAQIGRHAAGNQRVSSSNLDLAVTAHLRWFRYQEQQRQQHVRKNTNPREEKKNLHWVDSYPASHINIKRFTFVRERTSKSPDIHVIISWFLLTKSNVNHLIAPLQPRDRDWPVNFSDQAMICCYVPIRIGWEKLNSFGG